MCMTASIYAEEHACGCSLLDLFVSPISISRHDAQLDIWLCQPPHPPKLLRSPIDRSHMPDAVSLRKDSDFDMHLNIWGPVSSKHSALSSAALSLSASLGKPLPEALSCTCSSLGTLP